MAKSKAKQAQEFFDLKTSEGFIIWISPAGVKATPPLAEEDAAKMARLSDQLVEIIRGVK